MLISYDDFKRKLDEKIKYGDDFYYELLLAVIDKPERFTGIFRISNAKTKLLQNVTQSREIKFGDFMEEIMTEYLGIIGCENKEKNISDGNGKVLKADQYFIYNNNVFLIEQKVRDDHDSSKRIGQYDNFQKKYTLLRRLHPNQSIIATMWFIDNSLIKNRAYYNGRIVNGQLPDVEINIKYGEELFNDVIPWCSDVWKEICGYLEKNKQERRSENLIIPDFDNSKEFYKALVKLKNEKLKLFNNFTGKNINSKSPKYALLREQLFPNGYDFEGIPVKKKEEITF